MERKEVELLLARHAAPTLLGAKASSLVALPVRQFPFPAQIMDLCQKLLGGCGLRFRLLGGCPRTTLMLVYRPALLESLLRDQGAESILRGYGYPLDKGLDALLEHLAHRIEQERDFPHEIGLFLDYPPEDVLGFIQNEGAGCKLCGYWKVYSDVETARTRFACYDACRQCLCGLVEAGKSLEQLLRAA